MDKKTEDKFISLLAKIKDEELKSQFLKCFLDVSSQMDDLVLNEKKGCIPCISTCSNNNICNDNETDVKVDV